MIKCTAYYTSIGIKTFVIFYDMHALPRNKNNLLTAVKANCTHCRENDAKAQACSTFPTL